MRLVPINRRAGPPNQLTHRLSMPRAGRTRSGGGIRLSPLTRALGTVVLVALLLVGCSRGTANEAERAQRRAASEPAVLAHEQATRNAERFTESTPSAGPTATPAITVFSLGLTQQIQSDNEPSQMLATVPSNAGTVYVVIELSGVPEGSILYATWLVNANRPEDRTIIATVEQPVGDDGRHWVAFPFSLDGSLPPGMYAIVVEYEGGALGTLGVEVTNPGTAPRRV